MSPRRCFVVSAAVATAFGAINVCRCGAFVPSVALQARPASHARRLPHAFSSAQPFSLDARSRRRVPQPFSMLVDPKGSDSFKEIEAEVGSNPLRAALGRLSPTVAKTVLAGVVPAAAVAGAVIVPGGRVISALGAAVTGVVGNVARVKLSAQRRAAAPAAVARLLETKGVGDVTPQEVKAVLEGFGLVGEEAEEVCVQLYKRYLLAMCQSSAAKTAEIKELSELRDSLGLDGEMLGNAHYDACMAVYKQRVLFTPSEELSDEYSPDRRALDKFLFLSDRMFAVCDTEEAYLYEMGRIRKVLDLSPNEVKARCTAIAKPFYKKALDSVCQRLDSVRPEALQRARDTLGISEDLAATMHAEAYVAEARKALGVAAPASNVDAVAAAKAAAGAKLTDADSARLDKLATLLGLSADTARRELETVTVPLYEHALVEALDLAVGDATDRNVAKLYGKLAVLQGDLRLSPVSADAVMKRVIRARAAAHLEAAAKFVRVANAKKAAAATRELLNFITAASAVAVETSAGIEQEDDFAAKVFGGAMAEEATGLRESSQLYRIYLDRCLEDGVISTQEGANLRLLAKLLGQTSLDTTRAYRAATGPRVRERLEASVEDAAFTAEAKAANEKFVADLQIPAEVVAEQAKALYLEKLRAFGGNGRILTGDQKATLDKMKDFLGLDQQVVDGLHKEVCGLTYQQSVLESMGPTSVIPQELREALEKLRERLGLTAEAAKEIFYSAVKARMKPMLEQIFYEFERSVLSKDELARRRGRDAGDDPLVGGGGGELGIGLAASGAVTSDILNLIDFYEDNGVLIKKGKDAEGNEIYEFPVTAEGLTNAAVTEKLYTNFVVAAFSVEGEVAKRYEGGQRKLAGILNLDPKRVAAVNSEIGGTIVNQFVGQQLRQKQQLGPQELAFLANVQQKLNMPSKDFEFLMTNAKKKTLQFKAETLFQRSKVTPELAMELRQTASNVGIDLGKDIDLPLESRRKLFAVEATAAIEAGTLTAENRGLIEEMQEGYALPEATAQACLEDILEERASDCLREAAADAAANASDARIVRSVERLLRYCRLAGGLEVDYTMTDEVKERVFGTYMAAKSGLNDQEGAAEQLESDAELLREALRFREPAAVA